jgi:hypothetical protein
LEDVIGPVHQACRYMALVMAAGAVPCTPEKALEAAIGEYVAEVIVQEVAELQKSYSYVLFLQKNYVL